MMILDSGLLFWATL